MDWLWFWLILAFVGNFTGFYLLKKIPKFKDSFGTNKHDWLVNAVWDAALLFVPFLLICSPQLTPQNRNRIKDSLLLYTFLNFICLAFPAVIGHLFEYPGFHINVKDVEQHNSLKRIELFAAFSFASTSFGLSKAYDLTFEAGFFSLCLGYAMKVSLEVVDGNGNSDIGFISIIYSICFMVILLRKYLGKNNGSNTTRQENQSLDSTNRADQGPNNNEGTDRNLSAASNTDLLGRENVPSVTLAPGQPMQHEMSMPSLNGSRENVSGSQRDLMEINEQNWDVDDGKEMVVLAINSGRFYSVVEVATNTSAACPLSYADAIPSEVTSYIEYFNTTYGIRLMYPGQPLLRLKQSHKPHNLLVNFSEDASSSDTQVVEKEQDHVHMPPEILLKIDIPVDVLKAFYLLPSLMHSVESLMLASQLRKEINFNSGSLQIRGSLILVAFTTLKCGENFSLEHLELLGDSALKYAVNCYLFLRYPSKHEGQLSDWSSSLISNSTLYEMGTNSKLQGYIRDSAFEPCRWVALGQHCIYPVPCNCAVDTFEVPLDARFLTYNPAVRVGKFCDRGHSWMSSKTIADCVEALAGAYSVDGGLPAAIHTIKWLGLDVQIDESLIVEAIARTSIMSYVPKDNEISTLESKLEYRFFAKILLLKAVTHASQQELGVGHCYQRLEFLGNSILGLMLTWHFYMSYPYVGLGKLTDLQSAAVSNENFAVACVRRNLHPHLLHCSGFLQSQVTGFVRSLVEPHSRSRLQQSIKAPKALVDMIESIAGAMLVDTNPNLEEIWRIFEPLLSPIVTPDSLELPSLHKLIELCDYLGYFLKEECI